MAYAGDMPEFRCPEMSGERKVSTTSSDTWILDIDIAIATTPSPKLGT